MARDEAVKHDVLVLKSLRFVDGKQERRGKVLARSRLVFIAHDQHGELSGLADLAVQFALGRILVRQQRRLARLAAHGLDQEVALPIDGAETPLFDLEQRVGEARGLRARCGSWRSERAVPAVPPARGSRQKSVLTWLQEKKLGCTIWLESPQSMKRPGVFSVFSTSASCAVVRSCTSSTTTKS